MFENLKKFLVFPLFVLGLYTLTRILFFEMNPHLFTEVSGSQIFWSFLYGLRFDLSALFMNNGLLLLFVVCASMEKKWQQVLARWYFTLTNSFFLGLNVMDSEFYKFNGKRFGRDYLDNTEDLQRHSLSAILTYWWLFSIFLAVSLICYFAFPKLLRATLSKSSGGFFNSLKGRVVGSLIVVAMTVIAVRGGLQFKPITLVTAYAQGSQSLGALVLNTPFVFFKGHKSHLQSAPVFISDREEMFQIVERFRKDSVPFPPVSGIENVVVMVIESLSLEYSGLVPGQISYTPFLDQLAQHSIVFTQNYANGRRSIEAMPSIFCGLPSLVETPIITSSLSQNELHCLPEVLDKQGYSTAFFHGAHNGSFHMDAFAAKAGFQRFVGFDEFPNASENEDGHWGILDEPMLLYMASELGKMKKPFFAGVFTLSSHHPYFIPENLRDQFKEGPLEIHKSMGYADYSLRQFFAKAQKEDWFSKTLFVITGDHTQKNFEKKYQIFTGNYRVPLFFYSENSNFKERFLKHKNSLEAKVTQGADVSKTVLQVLGVDPKVRWPLFSGNALDPKESGLAVNFDGFQYWLRAGDQVVAVDRSGKLTQDLIVDSKGFEAQRSSIDPNEKVRVLESLVSFFNQSMRQNSVYKVREGQKSNPPPSVNQF
ncbi:MAG TPA: hypothetical protein DCL41_00240 [Bdellovibrionales bacterium]|nr:hypothetical protein [Bdellovibrionales bacterium]